MMKAEVGSTSSAGGERVSLFPSDVGLKVGEEVGKKLRKEVWKWAGPADDK